MARKLCEIASEIREDWKNIDVYAKPYVDAMSSLYTLKERYVAETGEDIVLYFLSNASKWRGEVAKRVKAELRKMLKEHQAQQ